MCKRLTVLWRFVIIYAGICGKTMNKDEICYVVGLKQVVRELKNNNVSKIILAEDADDDYKSTIHAAVNNSGVELISTSTRNEIAERYGIEVPSAVVGTLIAPISKK